MKTVATLSSAALALALSFALPHAAFAKDETPPATKTCSSGKVLDKATNKCVRTSSNEINDDERYEAVREYAYFGDYTGALSILASFEDQTDPRMFNYYGFINRKQGNMDAAMEYYAKALTINPDYILARAYMGQGLAAEGDLAGARAQLAEIRTRGGRNTWAYTSLAMALRGVQTNY